jgi:hypothetical protein
MYPNHYQTFKNFTGYIDSLDILINLRYSGSIEITRVYCTCDDTFEKLDIFLSVHHILDRMEVDEDELMTVHCHLMGGMLLEGRL